MELEQLRYFVCLANSDTMIKAAESLCISQSALSLSMKKLEEEFNLSFFKKDGRKKTLTKEGHLFLQSAKEIVELSNNLTATMHSLASTESQIINIHCDAIFIASDIIEAFQQLYPHIKVNFSRLEHTRAINSIILGNSDFFFSLDNDTSDCLTSECILEEEEILIVSNRHPFSSRSSIAISDLKGEQLIITRSLLDIMDQIFKDKLKAFANIVCYVDPEAGFLSVAKNKGVSLVPRSVFETHLQNTAYGEDKFVGIPIVDTIRRSRAYVTYSKKRFMSSASKLFLNFSKKYASNIQSQYGNSREHKASEHALDGHLL